MGNRAVITTPENFDNDGIGLYLHWNGGRDSVEGFLGYCRMRGFRSPDSDSYGWARLAQVAANFLGGEGVSVGVDKVSRLDMDNYDNGTYLIEGWDIVGRRFFDSQEQQEYDLLEMMTIIDSCQPEYQQLGKKMLRALHEEGLTVSSIDWNYSYTMARRKADGVEAKGFIPGRFYADNVRNPRNIVEIVSVDGETATVRYNGETVTRRIFPWTDGCQSIIVTSEDGRPVAIDSMKEVSS